MCVPPSRGSPVIMGQNPAFCQTGPKRERPGEKQPGSQAATPPWAPAVQGKGFLLSSGSKGRPVSRSVTLALFPPLFPRAATIGTGGSIFTLFHDSPGFFGTPPGTCRQGAQGWRPSSCRALGFCSKGFLCKVKVGSAHCRGRFRFLPARMLGGVQRIPDCGKASRQGEGGDSGGKAKGIL